jgi:PTH1 family peptidyl-tRNA hydrolase
MADTLLIAGLGNPGKQYENTRHNAGFMAVDAIAGKFGVGFSQWQGGKAVYAKVSAGGKTIYLLKPLTFMNLSGTAVSAFARFFKIPPQDILVIFDDMDIPLGAIRLRLKGSSGGQKGMKNIIEQFGTDNIPRLRLGIGPKPDFFQGYDFVLSKFSKEDIKLFQTALDNTLTAVDNIIAHGVEVAMNTANRN